MLSATWTNAASAAGAIGLVTVATRDREAIAAGTHFLVLEAYDGDGVIYLERDRPG